MVQYQNQHSAKNRYQSPSAISKLLAKLDQVHNFCANKHSSRALCKSADTPKMIDAAGFTGFAFVKKLHVDSCNVATLGLTVTAHLFRLTP